jgi:hypothetical protein
MKKLISVLLVFTLVFSSMALIANAEEVKTECQGNCEICPSIVVPGIGQSNVWILDENGDVNNMTTCAVNGGKTDYEYLNK